MSGSEDAVIVELVQTSFRPGDAIGVRLRDVDALRWPEVQCSIASVEKEDDYWCVTGSLTRVGDDAFEFRLPEALAPGLYRISEISLLWKDGASPADPESRRAAISPSLLFEVAAAPSPRSSDELEQTYAQILRDRREEMRAGIGDPRAAHTYRVFVFVGDCLLSTGMRIGPFEIGPAGALGRSSELQLMLDFCARRAQVDVRLDEPSFASKPGDRPCVAVHLPFVRADSPEAAADLTSEESTALLNSLALLRGSYGSVVGGVVLDHDGGAGLVWTSAERYRGNLMGGFLSGEHPRVIRHYASKARSDPRVALYLSLLRDAQAETRRGFATFRLWGLLETIARSKSYIGQPLVDWNGVQLISKKGRPQQIGDDARHLVFELIRRALVGVSERPLGDSMAHPAYGELVGIWCQRRNCMAHRGACLRHDPSVCDPRRANQHLCASAYDEVAGKPQPAQDRYYEALKATVFWLVQTECK